MLLKSSNTFDSLLLNIQSLKIVIRLLSSPSVVISALAHKAVPDTIDILYSVVDLIVSKMRPPPDTIFSSISILLTLRL